MEVDIENVTRVGLDGLNASSLVAQERRGIQANEEDEMAARQDLLQTTEEAARRKEMRERQAIMFLFSIYSKLLKFVNRNQRKKERKALDRSLHHH